MAEDLDLNMTEYALDKFGSVFEEAVTRIVSQPTRLIRVHLNAVVVDPVEGVPEGEPDADARIKQWERYVRGRAQQLAGRPRLDRVPPKYAATQLLRLIIQYISHRHAEASTGGTTARELARLTRVGDAAWPTEWQASARRIFKAYLTTNSSTSGGLTRIDGVALLRARMLAWSQYATGDVEANLRFNKQRFDEYVDLWRKAIEAAQLPIPADEVPWLVRTLAGLLEGMIIEAALQEPAQQAVWADRFARAAIAVIGDYGR